MQSCDLLGIDHRCCRELIGSSSAAPFPPLNVEPHFPCCWLPTRNGSKSAKGTNDQVNSEEPLKWVYRSCIHHKMRERLRLSRLSELFYITAPEPYQYTHIFYPVSLRSMASTETRSTPGRAGQLPSGSKTSCHKTYLMLAS